MDEDVIETTVPSRFPTDVELAGTPVIPRYPAVPNTDGIPTWIPPRAGHPGPGRVEMLGVLAEDACVIQEGRCDFFARSRSVLPVRA